MSIFGFQINNFGMGHEPQKPSREKGQVAPEAAERVKAANLYFDKNPPRAHSQAELDSLFKRR